MAACIARIRNAEIHLAHTLDLSATVLPEDGANAFDTVPFMILTEKKSKNFQ